MGFRGVDYFCVDSLFSEQELMVRQTARRFADERIQPLIRDCFRDARFPTNLIPEMAELGFLGAVVFPTKIIILVMIAARPDTQTLVILPPGERGRL